MRTLLLTLSLFLSLVSQAQIAYKLSYDKQTKIVNLNLTISLMNWLSLNLVWMMLLDREHTIR